MRFAPRPIGAPRPMNRQDLALRVLILMAGVLSAVLLALKGQAQAIPALAIGATLGVFAMRAGVTEE
jgi:hypothetical protein